MHVYVHVCMYANTHNYLCLSYLPAEEGGDSVWSLSCCLIQLCSHLEGAIP